MNPSALNFIRRLRPIDLLLPVGAALVSAGLQSLADRERRSRARLDGLADLALDHLQAFAAAGIAVPDELAADELHPLDPEVPWMELAAGGVPGADTDEVEIAPRRWKLVALGLAAATGVYAWNNRGAIAERVAGLRMPWPAEPIDPGAEGSTFNEDSSDEQAAADEWSGDRCTTCKQPAAWFVEEQTWRHVVPTKPAGQNARWSSHDVTLPDAVNEHAVPSGADGDEQLVEAFPETASTENGEEPPLHECGWPNCDWTSSPGRTEVGQATQAALHRNKCVYRPAGAVVTGT